MAEEKVRYAVANGEYFYPYLPGVYWRKDVKENTLDVVKITQKDVDRANNREPQPYRYRYFGPIPRPEDRAGALALVANNAILWDDPTVGSKVYDAPHYRATLSNGVEVRCTPTIMCVGVVRELRDEANVLLERARDEIVTLQEEMRRFRVIMDYEKPFVPLSKFRALWQSMVEEAGGDLERVHWAFRYAAEGLVDRYRRAHVSMLLANRDAEIELMRNAYQLEIVEGTIDRVTLNHFGKEVHGRVSQRENHLFIASGPQKHHHTDMAGISLPDNVRLVRFIGDASKP